MRVSTFPILAESLAQAEWCDNAVLRTTAGHRCVRGRCCAKGGKGILVISCPEYPLGAKAGASLAGDGCPTARVVVEVVFDIEPDDRDTADGYQRHRKSDSHGQ